MPHNRTMTMRMRKSQAKTRRREDAEEKRGKKKRRLRKKKRRKRDNHNNSHRVNCNNHHPLKKHNKSNRIQFKRTYSVLTVYLRNKLQILLMILKISKMARARPMLLITKMMALVISKELVGNLNLNRPYNSLL